jgi:energy-converting hydrogenase Eha subunit A
MPSHGLHGSARQRNDKLMSWEVTADSFVHLLGRIGEFLLSLAGSIIFLALLLLVSRLIRRRFQVIAERRGMRGNVPALFDNAVQAVVFVIIGFMILGAFGVNTASLATFAGLVTAALTISVQDVLKNIFCGFYLLAEQPFSPGDRVRVGVEDGYIERIDLRVTRIRNYREELVLVPNLLIFTQVVGARSTLRFRSLTVQIAGIQQPSTPAEEQIRETIGKAMPDGGASGIRLLKVGPDGCDFEVTVGRTETDAQQQEIIASLHHAFPDATISIIAR